VSDQHGHGRTWVWFSILRIGIFAAVLIVLLLVLPVPPWASALIAAVIAFCLSFLFLGKPRGKLSEDLARRRKPEVERTDDEAEDAALDSGNDLR
jgi:Flp pilus assembly protein TadB